MFVYSSVRMISLHEPILLDFWKHIYDVA